MKLSDLERFIRPLRRKVSGLFVRGVWRLGYGGEGMRRGQVTGLAGEVRDGVEAPDQYGFTSEPHPGAEQFLARIGGNPDHGIVLVVADRRYRIKTLAVGEVAMYDDQGSSVVFKRGGLIEIVSAGGLVKVTGDLEVSGNVKASGDVEDALGTLADLRTKYNAHTHVENGTGGGVTNPPAGPFQA